MDRRDDSWTYHSRASKAHKYVTVAVPKVACTTIKRALHEFEGIPAAPRLALEHDLGEHMRLSRFRPKELTAALTSPEWLRFAFVRNPYDRMLSAWKSKILDPRDVQYAPLRAEIRAAFAYPQADEDSPVVAFGDFVRFVTSTQHYDGHWNSQTSILACDRIAYDVIGRFENFTDDFVAILRQLGAPANVLAVAAAVNNPTPPLAMAAAYDTEVAAVVYDYYREDFDSFGYARDSWLTP